VTLRAFCIRGELAAEALEQLHVLADVRGAVEEDGAVTVWLDGAMPELALEGLAIQELSAEFANGTATGLENDRPILVAEDLLVRPPWVERPVAFSGIELVVPRGMAFGSGEHDSTQAALLALHATWNDPASFADVGTGSGILALYAHVRGCRRIEACDVEEPAVEAARELIPGSEVTLGGPMTMPWRADFVIANLTGAEQQAALDGILDRWTQKAPLVLSGMRAHEVDGIAQRLPRDAARLTRGAFTALTVLPSA
jgi:ribosomal protein L11 methylase PrmA